LGLIGGTKHKTPPFSDRGPTEKKRKGKFRGGALNLGRASESREKKKH